MTQSIFCAFCQPWPLESLSFLASLPCCQIQLSLSSSAAWYPLLLSLLWVWASLQSHLILCRRTQPLGDFCEAESPFSLAWTCHILQLLYQLHTWGSWSDQPPYPAQLPRLTPFSSRWGPSGAEMPQAPSRAHSLASVVCTGGLWLLTPSEDPCLWPSVAWRAHPSGPLPAHLACSPHVLPENALLGVFSRPGLHIVAQICLWSHPPRQFPEAFRRKEGLCVWVTMPALNALLSKHIRRQGVGLSILARLLPVRHNQHMSTWRQGSALRQHILGLGNTGWYRGAMGLTRGHTAEDTVSVQWHLYEAAKPWLCF